MFTPKNFEMLQECVECPSSKIEDERQTSPNFKPSVTLSTAGALNCSLYKPELTMMASIARILC